MPLREVEAALAAWRDADRRLSEADGRSTEELRLEVERLRQEFQRLSADHMSDQIDALREAERQRARSVPSTGAFHEAAEREKEIAAGIWDVARQSDEETPGAPD